MKSPDAWQSNQGKGYTVKDRMCIIARKGET